MFPCSILSLCTNCTTKACFTLIGAVTQILANKITVTAFSLVPVKYGINFTAAMGIFAWAKKQVWYWIF